MLARRSESGVWIPPDEAIAALGNTADSAIEGERRLMIAVLAHALRSLFHDAMQPGRGAARRLRQDLCWITSPDQTDPFAFERICETLGLDAGRIRERVLEDLGMQTAEPLRAATLPAFVTTEHLFASRRTAALG